MSPVESLCHELDTSFEFYNGKRININYRIAKFLITHSNSKAFGKYSAPYNSHYAGQELFGLLRIIKKNPSYVFFPYADFNYNYIWIFKKLLKFRIILYTFFSEDELENRFISLNHFENADLILVAGKGQLKYLSTKLSKPILKYFPLPIDTDFFKPGISFIPFRIIQSGANRRDFITLFSALDKLHEIYPEMIVDFIGCNSIKNIYRDKPYVFFHDFITDLEMLQLYQNAHLQLLIANDGGSSNSLSEGLACGLPLVITKLNNLIDYVDDECCKFVEHGNVFQIVDFVSEIFDDNSMRKRMSDASRLQGEKNSLKIMKNLFFNYLHELSN
jgi:glycosyltransferase involved in cell wall biosynthesis